MNNKSEREAKNYYSKDFDWDELREEVESNPSLQFHLLPYHSPNDVIADVAAAADRDSEAWDQFHSRHSTGKFFKERRYLLKEFLELASCEDHSKVLEVGCGNGSTALSVLHGRDSIILYACDCSSEALLRTKEIINADTSIKAKNRFHPFHCDFSTTGFPQWLACKTCSGDFLQKHALRFSEGCPGANTSHKINSLKPLCSDKNNCTGGMDFVTLIFTLSALPVERMSAGVAHCFSVLRPGGLLLFRDYGLYDMTMLRFEPEQRAGCREYLRSDGTRSYFFCLNTVRDIFSAAGFTEVELDYCCVKSVNRRNGKIMKRVWIHGKFLKPPVFS